MGPWVFLLPQIVCLFSLSCAQRMSGFDIKGWKKDQIDNFGYESPLGHK